MYCRNCGKEVDDRAVVCVGCGVPPLKGCKFCQSCGQTVPDLAEACTNCGVRLAQASKGIDDDKTWALLAHLLGLFTGFIGPLIIFLVKGKESEFVEDQSKEALNFQISLVIYWIASAILSLIVIGLVAMVALSIFQIIVIILATLKANSGERYRYPLCIRFIK